MRFFCNILVFGFLSLTLCFFCIVFQCEFTSLCLVVTFRLFQVTPPTGLSTPVSHFLSYFHFPHYPLCVNSPAFPSAFVAASSPCEYFFGGGLLGFYYNVSVVSGQVSKHAHLCYN